MRKITVSTISLHLYALQFYITSLTFLVITFSNTHSFMRLELRSRTIWTGLTIALQPYLKRNSWCLTFKRMCTSNMVREIYFLRRHILIGRWLYGNKVQNYRPIVCCWRIWNWLMVWKNSILMPRLCLSRSLANWPSRWPLPSWKISYLQENLRWEFADLINKYT